MDGKIKVETARAIRIKMKNLSEKLDKTLKINQSLIRETDEIKKNGEERMKIVSTHNKEEKEELEGRIKELNGKVYELAEELRKKNTSYVHEKNQKEVLNREYQHNIIGLETSIQGKTETLKKEKNIREEEKKEYAQRLEKEEKEYTQRLKKYAQRYEEADQQMRRLHRKMGKIKEIILDADKDYDDALFVQGANKVLRKAFNEIKEITDPFS